MLIDILEFFRINIDRSKKKKETKELKQAYKRKTKKIK
tara:strand:- start:508 stop:621 length:114 start_codon:yes stop_codon:yes gene_type:complete